MFFCFDICLIIKDIWYELYIFNTSICEQIQKYGKISIIIQSAHRKKNKMGAILEAIAGS